MTQDPQPYRIMFFNQTTLELDWFDAYFSDVEKYLAHAFEGCYAVQAELPSVAADEIPKLVANINTRSKIESRLKARNQS